MWPKSHSSTFTVTSSDHLGSLTRATVKVINPVGVEYIELNPGLARAASTGTIPVSRTTIPGTLVSDLNQLTEQHRSRPTSAS